jgi:SnoaL-like domain
VEIVRRSIEAFNRRDLRRLMGFYRSDAEIDYSRSRAPFKGVYRGHREIEAFWDVFWSMFEEVSLRRTATCRPAPKSWSRTPSTFGGATGSK